MGYQNKSILYFLLIVIESLICAVILILIPRETQGAFLFGFSLSRCAALLVFLLTAGISAGMVVSLLKNSQLVFRWLNKVTSLALKHDQFTWLCSFTLLCLSALALLFPDDQVTTWTAFYERLKPFFLFLFFVSFQNVILLTKAASPVRKSDDSSASHPRRQDTVRLFLIFFVGFSSIALAIAGTRLGVTPSDFWEKNGVPLLFTQLVFVILITFWLHYLYRRLTENPSKPVIFLQSNKIEILICLGLYAFTCLLWVLEPLPYNAFNPGPFPPNHQYYPYSDAAYYYSYTEWARIGNPIPYVDKPIYSALLFMLRLISNHEFNQILTYQTILFAVFPVLIYVLAKKLFSRIAGIFCGLIAVFQVRNTIAGSLFLWKVSHPKMAMSEFPLGIIILLLTITIILFLRQPGKKTKYALLAGGIFGLSTLLRHNVWLFFPFLLIFFLYPYQASWRKSLTSAGIFLIAFIISILPWSLRTYTRQGTPFYFMIPFRGVILEERYRPSVEVTPELKGSLDVQSGQSAGKELTPAEAENQTSMNADALALRILGHFFHNLVANFFTLPSDLSSGSLVYVTRQSNSSSLWDYVWDGKLITVNRFFIIFNLFCLAIGLTSAYHKSKGAGLVPIGFFAIYNLSLAAATTSGGRYILPTNWVIYLYYAEGILAILQYAARFFHSGFPSQTRNGNQKSLPKATLEKILIPGWLAMFAFIGATPVIFENLFPLQYESKTKTENYQELISLQTFEMSQSDAAWVNNLLEEDEIQLFHGSALYPRYFDYRSDESSELFKFIPKDQPQLTFQLIGPLTALVLLPQHEAPDIFPNESEVYVLGCPLQMPGTDIYVDYQIHAFAVWLVEKGNVFFYRDTTSTKKTCQNE